MKKLIKNMGVILIALLLLGCDKKPDENNQNTTDNEHESQPIQPVQGMSPQEFFLSIGKIDKSTRYKRAVITYSITQTASGTTQKKLKNGDPFQEGTFESSRVIEVTQGERGELAFFSTKEQTNYLSADEDYLTDGQKTPLTVWEWESYQTNQRLMDKLIYQVYSESFSVNPYNASMTIADMEGTKGNNSRRLFNTFENNERTFDNDGFLTNIRSSKKIVYLDNAKKEIGIYEIVCNGTVEYFEKDTSDLSPEQYEEVISKINYGTYVKANIEYTTRECIIGSMPGVTYQNGDPLPDGSFLTLKTDAEQTSDLKVTCNYPNPSELSYSVKELVTGANVVNIKGWLSYHKQRRPNEHTTMVEGEGMYEKLYTDPYKTWMKIVGRRIPNAQLEGTFYGFEEYDRTFDENGLVNYLSYREYREIDGNFKRNDTKEKYYKGTYLITVEARITYDYE